MMVKEFNLLDFRQEIERAGTTNALLLLAQKVNSIIESQKLGSDVMQTAPKCKCRVVIIQVKRLDPKKWKAEIFYCPLHAAAEEMLKMLEEIEAWEQRQDSPVLPAGFRILGMIHKAEGRKGK